MFNTTTGTIFKIKKILLMESGTYNPMFRRPYQSSHVTENLLENVNRRVEAANNIIVPGTFDGIANQILTPVVTPVGNVNIINGWNEKRFRFVMEVEAKHNASIVIYYMQGYTNYLDTSMSNLLDPKMEFIINSFIRVTRLMQYTPNGMMPVDTVTRSAQVINGAIIDSLGTGDNFTTRPNDLFGLIQTGYIRNEMANNGVSDDRTKLNQETRLSYRENNLSSRYLSDVIGHHSEQSQMEAIGLDKDNIVARCVANTYEESPAEIDFFNYITKRRGFSMMSPTVLSWGELQGIDPDVNHTTVVGRMGTLTQQTGLPENFNNHMTGTTAFWNATDRETQVATIITNTIPGIMMELMMGVLWFNTSNAFPGGQVVTAIKASNMLTTLDARPLYGVLYNRIANELMADITYGGNDIINLDVCIDIFGDSRIEVQINGRSPIVYTAPSYADSLVSPIINNSLNNCFGMAKDIEQICSSVSSNTLPSMMLGYQSPAFNNGII